MARGNFCATAFNTPCNEHVRGGLENGLRRVAYEKGPLKEGALLVVEEKKFVYL